MCKVKMRKKYIEEQQKQIDETIWNINLYQE